MDNLATLQARHISPSQLNALKILNLFLDRSLFARRPKRISDRLVMLSEVPSKKIRPTITAEEAKKMIGPKAVTLHLTLSDEATSEQKRDAELIRQQAAKINIKLEISQAKTSFRGRWENEDYELTMTRMGVYAYDEVELLNGYFCEGFKPYRSFKDLVCDKINKATQPG